MAGVRPVQPCRRAAHGREPVQAARGAQPGDPDHRRGRVRRIGAAAEPRHRANQRDARRAADRGHPRAGGGAGRRAGARRGAAGRLARVRPLTGRREHHRRRSGGRLQPRRGRPCAGSAVRLGRLYRLAGATAARSRPGGGHRGSAHGGGRGGASGRTRRRARAGRGREPGGAAGHRGTGARGHRAADNAVRVRAEPGPGCRRRSVPQPGAAVRRRHRDRAVRRSARRGPGGRGSGRAGRPRTQQLPGGPGCALVPAGHGGGQVLRSRNTHLAGGAPQAGWPQCWPQCWSRPDRGPLPPARPGAFRR